jgi:hypothetical protein
LRRASILKAFARKSIQYVLDAIAGGRLTTLYSGRDAGAVDDFPFAANPPQGTTAVAPANKEPSPIALKSWRRLFMVASSDNGPKQCAEKNPTLHHGHKQSTANGPSQVPILPVRDQV